MKKTSYVVSQATKNKCVRGGSSSLVLLCSMLIGGEYISEHQGFTLYVPRNSGESIKPIQPHQFFFGVIVGGVFLPFLKI